MLMPLNGRCEKLIPEPPNLPSIYIKIWEAKGTAILFIQSS